MNETQKQTDVKTGISLVLLSSLIFAFVPNFAKISLDSGASLFFLIISRYAIGALILLPIMYFRKNPIKVLSFNQIRRICFSSFCACTLITLTYHAVEYLDVGIVMIILYCFPIGVALVLHIQRKHRLVKKQWLFMICVLVGLSMMFKDKDLGLNTYGLLISFLGLVFFILFIVTSAELSDQIGAIAFNFYISVIGILFLIIAFFLPFNFHISISGNIVGHFSVIGNGIFYIVSWVIFFEAARIIGATRTSLLACSEPLFAALIAIPLLGQKLSSTEWIGFFIVLSSLYMFEKNSSTSAQ